MRPQLTVRQMLAAVALVGVVLGLLAYRERLKARTAYHEGQVVAHWVRVRSVSSPPPVILVVRRRGSGAVVGYRMTPHTEWHARMAGEASGAADRAGVLAGAVVVLAVALVAVSRGRRRTHDAG